MNTTKTTKQGDEYRVRLFVNGEYQAGADYFTDDKRDAKETAAVMVKNGGLSDKATNEAICEQAEYNEEIGIHEDEDEVLFDVCNDYSLEIASPVPVISFKVYREQEHTMDCGETITVYIHKEYNEVHYCKGPRYLNGRYL